VSRRGDEQRENKKPRPTAGAVIKGRYMSHGSGTGNRTPI
jgi:hypothetical protein